MSDKDHLSGFTNKPNASSIPASYGARLKAWWDPDVSFTNVKQAASFTAASGEYLVKTTPSWNVGVDDDFWGSAWVSITDETANRVFVAKATNGADRQFFVFYDNPSDRFIFNFGNSGSVIGVTANNFGAVPASTTCHVFWYHNAATNTMGIQVNGGTVNTQTYSDGAIVVGSTVNFTIGGLYTTGATALWNGTIDAVVVGKNPAGGIESVRSALVSALYNGGAGLQPSLLTSAQRTDWGVVAGYDLDEYSAGSGAVTRNDAIGTDHLTDTNTVPSATGLITGAVSDDDPIFEQLDRSGNIITLTQATISKQPLFDTTIDSDGFMKFDGSNDILAHTAANPISTASSGEFYAVIRPSSVTGTQCIFCTADESVADKFLSIQLNGTFLEVAQNEAGTENRVTGDTVLAINTAYVIGVISTGTAWELRVNGVIQSLTVASGANNGNWFADTTGRDSATLGARKTTSENTFFNGYIGEAFLIDP